MNEAIIADHTDTHYIVKNGVVKEGDLMLISSYNKKLYGAWITVHENRIDMDVNKYCMTIIRKKKGKLVRLGIKT